MGHLGRAVVGQGTVGVEGGDGIEALADEVLVLGAFLVQAGLDVQLGDPFAGGEGGLQPGEEATQGRAVGFHGLTHEAELVGCLDALGQGAGLEGFDHGHLVRQGLAGPQRQPGRIDQYPFVPRQGGQPRRPVGVVGHLDAIGLERIDQFRSELAGCHEQSGGGATDQQVGQEHRIEAHVGTAQGGQPGDVVQRRHQMPVGVVLGHGRAYPVQTLAPSLV